MQASQPPPPYLKFLRDDNMSQACKDLLSSLPSEAGWNGISLHLYQGCWFLPWILKGVLAFQSHFQAHPSDILLATCPKSGSTWLMAILFALLNRAKYSDTDCRHPLLTQNPHNLVPSLEAKLYLEQEKPDLTSFAPPRLFLTHLPYSLLPRSVRDSKCKLVYLCRNPKDNFVSLWHFINKLTPEEKGQTPLPDCLDMFCRGLNPFGPFWEHVLGYHKVSSEMPEEVLFLTYEEMKEEPRVHVRRLADFVGCPFSDEELRDGTVERILAMCSFDNLSALEVNKSGTLSTGPEKKSFFRRGQVGDWVNYLSAEMADRIDQAMEEKLHGSGLKFKYK